MEKLSSGLTDLQSFGNTGTIAQILQAVQRKTDLTNDTAPNEILSLPQRDEYLAMMTKNDLLRFDNASETYKLTRKGDAFLKTYQQAQEFIKIIDEELGL